MKLVHSVSLCIVLICSTLNAQSTYFNITESEKFSDQNKFTEVLAVHTTDNNETAIARSAKRKLIFETFDETAKSTFNMFADLHKKESVVGNLFYNNELKIFTVYSPSKTERIINCYILNIETKKYTKVKLFETTVEKKQVLFSGQNKRQTNVAVSPNGNFLAIATDNIKKNTNSYIIHVFNGESLELIYTKSYYTNTEKHFKSSDMIIDNNGSVYNLGKEFISGKREKKDGKANYTFVINKIDKEDVSIKKINLPENELIEALKIIVKENKLNLIGFYSEKNVRGIKGITQFKINKKSLAILEKKNTELPKEVYQDIYGYRKAPKKKEKELKSFYLDHIIEDDLGNTYLLAEEFYITQVYVSNGMNGGGYWSTVYHYDDILIVKFNNEGNLEWGRSIFKRATTASYNAFVKDDKLHVFLNSGKNLKEKEDGRTKVSKGWLESTALYDFVYDDRGLVTHEKIQNNKNKTTYIPYLGNYKNDKFVMFNHSRNNRQLMILEAK